MPTVIGKLNAVLTANTMGLDTALTRSSKKLKGFEQTAHIVASGMASVGKKAFIGAGAAVAAGLAVMTQRTHKAFGDMDKLGKVANRLGDSTENISGLAYAANLADVNFEDLAKSMTRQSVVIGKALNGNKAAIDIFSSMGLDPATLAKQSPTEALLSIGSALEKIPTQAQRLDKLRTIFGRGGDGLATLLQGGTAEIRKMIAENARLNNSFSALDARKIEAANDAFTTTNAALDGLGKKAAVWLAPTMVAVANTLSEAFVNAGNNMSASGDWLLDTWIDVRFFFQDFFKLMAGGILRIQIMWGDFIDKFNTSPTVAGTFWGELFSEISNGKGIGEAISAASSEAANAVAEIGKETDNLRNALDLLNKELADDYTRIDRETREQIAKAFEMPKNVFSGTGEIGDSKGKKTKSNKEFSGAFERGTREAYSIEIGAKNSLDRIARATEANVKETRELRKDIAAGLPVTVDNLGLAEDF